MPRIDITEQEEATLTAFDITERNSGKYKRRTVQIKG